MSHSAGTPAAHQPSPVVDKATVAAAVTALVAVVVTVAAVLGLDLDVDQQAIAGGVGVAVTALNFVLPLVQAKRAAAQVTPVASPRDDVGHELVPLDDIDRGLAGQVGEGVLQSDPARYTSGPAVDVDRPA